MFESKVILSRDEYDAINNQIRDLEAKTNKIMNMLFSKSCSFDGEKMTCLINWEDVTEMFPKQANEYEEITLKKAREDYYKNV